MNRYVSDIDYSNDLIVVVKHKKKWSYYLSFKDLWILDQKKWVQSCVDFRKKKGKSLGLSTEITFDIEDFSDRFDIPIVNETTVDIFLKHMKIYKCSMSSLKELYERKKSEDLLDSTYYPGLFVDFDNKKLISYYPEPFGFEYNTPDGWKGLYYDFCNEIPKEFRFWDE